MSGTKSSDQKRHDKAVTDNRGNSQIATLVNPPWQESYSQPSGLKKKDDGAVGESSAPLYNDSSAKGSSGMKQTKSGTKG